MNRRIIGIGAMTEAKVRARLCWILRSDELEVDDDAVDLVHLMTSSPTVFALSYSKGRSENQVVLRRRNGSLIAATRLSPSFGPSSF